MIERVVQCSPLAVGLALMPSVLGAQVTTHLEHNLGWANGAVTNAVLDGRLGQAAAQYRSYAPVPRIAFYDIAYPKDCTELAAMEGHAVLVLTAVVQDSAELPPARVYLRSGVRGVELARAAGVQSRVVASEVRQTFGQFRVDVVYLLPSGSNGDVLVDFAVHRQGFRLAQLSGEVPKPLTQCAEPASRGQPPAAAVLWTLVRREYPDLSQALAPPE